MTPAPVVQRLVARLPAWAGVIAAVLCVGAGALLTVRPFMSIQVLLLLIALNAIFTGALELIALGEALSLHRVLVGLGWLLVGVAIAARPGLSVDALSIVIGIGLVATGLIDVGRIVAQGRWKSQTEHLLSLLVNGLAAVVFGLLALSWPEVTIFVAAILFGARTVLFGLSQLISIITRRRPSSTELAATAAADKPSLPQQVLRLAAQVGALMVALVLLAVSVVIYGQAPATAGDFYTPPATIPTTPGVLLRTEPFSHGVPDDSRAWLILYSTETSLGAPTVGTAIVLAPRDLKPGPRPVVAWTHGTVGITQSCAPSLHPSPFDDLPAIPQLLRNGWVMVATDYVGMGTEGVSPYLIGPGEAYSALDSVRAAHFMRDVSLANQTVVWGHSQGGHAALWTGILAPAYAPDVVLNGVAALAPATDVLEMARWVQGRQAGSLGSAYVIAAYSQTYADVSFDDYVQVGARVQAAGAAQRCLSDPALLTSLITTLPSSQSIFSIDPTTGPLGERLRQNTPAADVPAPLLVAQGTSDEVIPFAITQQWVAQRCAAGQPLAFDAYPGLTHMSLLSDDSLQAELVRWTTERLDGTPAPNTCSAVTG